MTSNAAGKLPMSEEPKPMGTPGVAPALSALIGKGDPYALKQTSAEDMARQKAELELMFPPTLLDDDADNRFVLHERDDHDPDPSEFVEYVGPIEEDDENEYDGDPVNAPSVPEKAPLSIEVPIAVTFSDGSAEVADTGQEPIYGPDDSPALPPDDPIESLAPLHAEMAVMGGQLSEYGALHGPGGKYDDVRKELLSSIKSELFVKYTPAEGKPIPAMADRIDAEAHADQRYKDFLAASVKEHQQYNALALRLAMLRDRIQRSNALIYLSGQQARLV